ncbi:MAG: hypothetical protein Q7J73_05395 [Dehalococcoidales bacterium]|nr:hypothetical protein [Dehalococcoidales bacterium]
MSSRWQEAYARLQEFVKAKPSITISTIVLAIPGDVRTEFYRHFDDVRVSFVEEKFPAFLEEAVVLGQNYTRAEQEVKELLKLDSIVALGFLNRFLHEPKNELIKGLFDPLFELLRGTIDSATFEQKGLRDIQVTFERSHRLGYAKWMALSLVKMLESDRLFTITPPESKMDGHNEPLLCEWDVSSPQESKILSFEHGPDNFPPFITPHFIVHSAKLNRYVAVRTELFKTAEYIALNYTDKREWYHTESIEKEYKAARSDPSLLIYIGDELDELALIADHDRMYRPDMIVEYRELRDWEDKDMPARTKLFDVLNPKLGRYIVSRDPLPVQVPQETPLVPVAQQLLVEQGTETEERAANRSLEIGFDQSKLEPIIQTLVNYDNIELEKM